MLHATIVSSIFFAVLIRAQAADKYYTIFPKDNLDKGGTLSDADKDYFSPKVSDSATEPLCTDA